MIIANDSAPTKKIHEKPKHKKFLISAKKLYLTYSKCPLEFETIIILLKEILSSYIVENYLIVREYHETGEAHVHVYLKLLKKANISSATFLDLVDSLGNIYHGNYQSARKPNAIIEYMLKSIKSKTDSNLYYSPSMSNVIGDLGEYKTLSESLIDLAEKGKVFEAMEFLKKTDPDMYLKQGNKLEKRLIDIYKDKFMKNQSQYDLESFYISLDMYIKLSEYIKKLKLGENPVLSIVGAAGIGKTHFLISFFEQVLNCQVIVIKDSDGLRHISFFKGKRYAIIFDDLAWLSENMTRERMLQLLSGEVTTNANIKHSSVLVPKGTCRALTSNYSLHSTQEFQKEEEMSGSGLTCFTRRLHEINLGNLKLHLKDGNLVSASIFKNIGEQNVKETKSCTSS